MPPELISEKLDAVAHAIVDSAFRVYSSLGPGLLESVYEAFLTHELVKRGLDLRRQVWVPVVYDSIRIDAGLRLDLVVEDGVIVEIKAVERLAPIHQAQLLPYLRLSGLRLGFLINFNVPRIKDGIRRLAL